MRLHQFVFSVVALSVIGLAWISPQRGTADQPSISVNPADLVGDGVIDAQDLVAVMLNLGPCQGCPAEMNGDGVVDAWDVLVIIAGLGEGAGDEPPMTYGSSMHICAVEDGAFATADGGCKDLATDLVWSSQNMGVTGGGVSLGNAEQAIADSSEGGFSDWRMPTAEEMQTVAANGSMTHFNGFPCQGGTNFPWWSSDRRGRWNYGVNICNGDTDLYQARGPVSDFIYFVGVRDLNVGDPPDPPSGSCNDNGNCDPGEDCETCDDCDGKTNGPPSGRYCCGNGVSEPPEADGRCDGND